MDPTTGHQFQKTSINPIGKSVLVTGGAGFIGRWLVNTLSTLGAEVTVIDDLSTSPDFGSLRTIKNVRVLRDSVLNPQLLRGQTTQFDLVFHLAGIVGMRLAHQQALQAHRVAEEGTLNIVRATGQTPIVFFSSSSVYGLSQKATMSEETPILAEEIQQYDAATFGYASGKAALEGIARKTARTGRSCLVVRPFNVVGAGQSRHYGMVLPRFLHAAALGAPLRVYDDGLQTRSFSCVQRFIDYLLTLCCSPEAFASSHPVYNLGNPNATSVLDLARSVLQETHSKSIIQFVPYSDDFPDRKDVRQRKPSLARLEKIIGATHWPSIDEIVQSCVQQRDPDQRPFSSTSATKYNDLRALGTQISG